MNNQITQIIPGPATSYEHMLEVLRTRLNVLNTSVFLLEDNLSEQDKKTSHYIAKINAELDRIRHLINQAPEQYNQDAPLENNVKTVDH
jgi:signal transduction histidine kinase